MMLLKYSNKGICVFVSGLAVLTAGGYLAWRIWKKKMRQVAVVSQIFVYPVKSCKPIALKSVFCGERGLEPIEGVSDRKWMLVRGDGKVRNLNDLPLMSQITPSFQYEEKTLHLDAPDMNTLSLPIFPKADKQLSITCNVYGCLIEGQDCGRDAADWFCKLLKTPDLRLVAFLHKYMDQRNYKSTEYQLRYANTSPYMMMAEESVQALNEKLDEQKVSIKNFRPNIVVSETKAFSEDSWETVKIGGKVALKRLEACARCAITTINPEDGVRYNNYEPLKTLKTFRLCKTAERKMYKGSPLMGIHFGAEHYGMISVGDKVFANYL